MFWQCFVTLRVQNNTNDASHLLSSKQSTGYLFFLIYPETDNQAEASSKPVSLSVTVCGVYTERNAIPCSSTWNIAFIPSDSRLHISTCPIHVQPTIHAIHFLFVVAFDEQQHYFSIDITVRMEQSGYLMCAHSVQYQVWDCWWVFFKCLWLGVTWTILTWILTFCSVVLAKKKVHGCMWYSFVLIWTEDTLLPICICMHECFCTICTTRVHKSTCAHISVGQAFTTRLTTQLFISSSLPCHSRGPHGMHRCVVWTQCPALLFLPFGLPVIFALTTSRTLHSLSNTLTPPALLLPLLPSVAGR